MKLKLFWKDLRGDAYMLGELYKDGREFCFDINEEELKKATHNGCFGIGELNLFYTNHRKNELFDFFKRRIPAKDSYNIKEILEELDIKEYDEMELLKKTKGILYSDRYYLEEEK